MKAADPILEKMMTYFHQKNMPVVVKRINNGYSILNETGEPIARFRATSIDSCYVEVLYRHSLKNKWAPIGDFGGLMMDIDAALNYLYTDPMQLFWQHHPLIQSTIATRNVSTLRWINTLKKLFR